MIVIAIVGILAALVIPNFARSREFAQLHRATRKIVGVVARARTLAATGKNENYAGWAPTDRTVQSGILITATGYQLFVDRNRILDGDEILIEVVDYATIGTIDYAQNVQLTAPAPGTEIRFDKNGTLSTPSDVNVILRDAGSGVTETVRIAYGGSTKIL